MPLRSPRPPGGQPIPQRTKLTSPSAAPIERLQLTVLHRLDGLLSGDYAGLFPGHGTERGEARPYVPGDDPRHIDWAVTARNHEPHVRDMIADHELDVWIVLDTSSSLAFGSALTTKYEVAWSVAGAFALLASRAGNRVGAVTTTVAPGKGRPTMFPARGGSSHAASILAGLRPEPEDGHSGSLGDAIDMVGRAAKRRGMVVVVSDFLDDPDWEIPLRRVASRHDVVAAIVRDPIEQTLPDVGLVAVMDPETGARRLLDTAPERTRIRYAEVAEERMTALASSLTRARADHFLLQTDRDWVLDFVRFVANRKSRLLSSRRSA